MADAERAKPEGGTEPGAMTQATRSPRRAAARGAILGVLVALLSMLFGIAHPTPAAAAEPTGVLEIVTVPAVPGARLVVDGQTHRANHEGIVRIKVSSLDRHQVSLIDKEIAQPSRDLSFVRWYFASHQQDYQDQLNGLSIKRHLQIKVAYRVSYKLQYSFVDKARNPVDRERVARVEFRGDHGQTVSGDGSGVLRVVGIRPMVSGGTLLAKEIGYSVQRVDIDGSNVVQVNSQRFVPSQETTVVIPLQLHTVHFRTRDLLFGDPVGATVSLKYPDGRQVKVPLDANGEATVERLARGSYTVRIDAPGLSFERPLVLSRNQHVELQHVSRLDLWVVAGSVAALMFSLYLVRIRRRSTIVRSARLRSAQTWAASRRS
jgi:hypothetical protein